MVVNKVTEHKFHKLSSNLSCVLFPFTAIQNHQQNNEIDHIIHLFFMKQMRIAPPGVLKWDMGGGYFDRIVQNLLKSLKPESPEKLPKV